jgi:hydroxymethylbilane synthase
VLRLGTRGSPLALAQARSVQEALAAAHPGLRVEIVVIRTSGDASPPGVLPPGGAKGLFVKEIEEALLAAAVDAGVHSMKDLPARLAPGLVVGAVPARAPAHDVLVSGEARSLEGLPAGTRVGTSSVRRRAQLLAHRRDLEVVSLRGNVDTRLRRWRERRVDALVLAAAGLVRLGIVEPGAVALPPEEFVPAVGQGALAIECCLDDGATRHLLAALEDATAATAVAAERSFLATIGGDCNTPLGAHASVAGGEVVLRVLAMDHDGRRVFRETGRAPAGEAQALGRALGERLLAAGVEDVLGR